VACHNRESCQAAQTVQRIENAPILPIQCTAPEVGSARILRDSGSVLAPLIELDVEAGGAFYINDVAVFPEYRHAGIARKLIEFAFGEAKKADLAAANLATFEEGRRLVDYYCGIGFGVVASRPIVPHARTTFGGNLFLTASPVRYEHAWSAASPENGTQYHRTRPDLSSPPADTIARQLKAKLERVIGQCLARQYRLVFGALERLAGEQG